MCAKGSKRVLRTPPGDLPEASRRRKSTPKGASEGTSTFPNYFFSGPEGPQGALGSLPDLFRRRPGASGLVFQPPGPLRGRPGTLSGTISESFSAYFRRVCFGFASARNLISNGTPTHESCLNQRGETTDTTRIKGAGTHRTAHMTNRGKLDGDICLKLRQMRACSQI